MITAQSRLVIQQRMAAPLIPKQHSHQGLGHTGTRTGCGQHI